MDIPAVFLATGEGGHVSIPNSGWSYIASKDVVDTSFTQGITSILGPARQVRLQTQLCPCVCVHLTPGPHRGLWSCNNKAGSSMSGNCRLVIFNQVFPFLISLLMNSGHCTYEACVKCFQIQKNNILCYFCKDDWLKFHLTLYRASIWTCAALLQSGTERKYFIYKSWKSKLLCKKWSDRPTKQGFTMFSDKWQNIAF